MRDGQIAGLADYEHSDEFSELERLCLRLSDAMTRTPAEVSPGLFGELEERLGPAAIVELTSTIAWENYRARQNRALGVESDNFSEGAQCALPAPRDAILPA